MKRRHNPLAATVSTGRHSGGTASPTDLAALEVASGALSAARYWAARQAALGSKGEWYVSVEAAALQQVSDNRHQDQPEADALKPEAVRCAMPETLLVAVMT